MPHSSSKCSDRRTAAGSGCLPFITNRSLSSLFINAVLLSAVFGWCLQAVATTSNDKTTSGESESVEDLDIEIVHKPSECETKSETGKTLKVHFTGYLQNGTEFDTSRGGRNVPFVFVLGGGRVIKGWDLGLLDMCVGEKRHLVIPPHLGYGPQGFGRTIGPDQKVSFDIELIEVVDTEPRDQEESFSFTSLDLDNDGFLQRDEVKEYLKKMAVHLEELAIEMETLGGQRDLVSKVMEIHDANKDGLIDEREFYTPSSGDNRDEL